MALSSYEWHKRNREYNKQRAQGRAAEDAQQAFVNDVDVVFAPDCDPKAVNVFAVVVGDIAFIVHAGKVVKVVSRKDYMLGAFKKHDLFENLRLFG